MTWKEVRLKHVARLLAGGTPDVSVRANWAEGNEGFPWISIGDMSNRTTVGATARRISETGLKVARLQLAPPGTLLFSMYASLGHTAILSEYGSWNQAILGIVPKSGVESRYINYSLMAWRQRLPSLARSATQDNLNAEQVGNLTLLLPSLEEQRRIADFLDAETDLLDRAMERMRTQLALLEERELADVYATVSGARISGARKASGMDWLGDIPIDWPVASVSSQFQVQLGKMLNQERTRGARLRPYLRVLNVQWDRVDVTELVEMDFPEAERARYEVLPGDLLICEGGIAGRAAIWDGKIPEIYYQKALHRARSRGRSSVRWLYYCLRLALAMGVFQAEGNSSTITHLTGEQLASRRFPFPNSEVQNQLVVELDKESERRRVLREAREKQIELLEERRRAVVTAAVTGELDVTTARGVSSV